MLKKVNLFLNILIGTTIGLFIGYAIFVYWDYRSHPGLYAMNSAPWHTGILVSGLFTAAFLLVFSIAKFIVKKKLKKG